jgi:hypothetical protein
MRAGECYPPAVTGSIAGLFNGPMYERRVLQDRAAVIAWWEKRRFFYNKVLAVVGAVTCILMISCGVISEPLLGAPIGIPDPPILAPLGIIFYGVMANICYTGGWIAELLLARYSPVTHAELFGVRAFRLGVKFSIALTIFPALLCWGVFLFSLIIGRRLAQGAS